MIGGGVVATFLSAASCYGACYAYTGHAPAHQWVVWTFAVFVGAFKAVGGK